MASVSTNPQSPHTSHERCVCAVGRVKRSGDVLGNGGRDLNRRQHRTQQGGESLLANVAIAARAVGPRAPVVHVPTLLLLGRHRAAAPGTREQAHKGMLLFWIASARLAAEDGLHLIERLARDE